MRFIHPTTTSTLLRSRSLHPWRRTQWSRHYSTPPIAPTDTPEPSKEYHGPLDTTFRRLKVFSLGTLGLSTAFSPFLFIVESSLPLSARFALAGTAVATSLTSTAIVQWIGGPYVSRLKRFSLDSSASLSPSGKADTAQNVVSSVELPKAEQGIEMVTLSLALRERTTRVYDTSFLVPTRRPLATWELATVMPAPTKTQGHTDTNEPREFEETIAETLEKDAVIGRWIVKWGLDGNGTCREVGSVVKYFNVHEELLK